MPEVLSECGGAATGRRRSSTTLAGRGPIERQLDVKIIQTFARRTGG